VDRRIVDAEPPTPALTRRSHGSLDAITDSERRTLRPIGATVREVAGRTSALLADLLALPGVRIFEGVRSTAADMPRIPHAVCAGCRLMLVESVAWPPGHYAARPTGHIHCDDVYIGQSVAPLMAAVRHWRGVLPRGHRVRAMIVVYPTAKGEFSLPASTGRDLTWTRAGDAVSNIRAYLPSDPPPVSIRAIAALIAATVVAEDGQRWPGSEHDAAGAQSPGEG